MNYLETVGKNAKKAFEDLKNVKHKKIKSFRKLQSISTKKYK